jgi:hypothetical protein
VPIRERVKRFAARTSSVECLLERIDELSRERQDLRLLNADQATLERNRLEIVDAQWELSRALIRRYLPEQLAA